MGKRAGLVLFLKSKLAFIAAVLIFVLSPAAALAADSEYEKNPAKWFENDNVQTVQTIISGTYDGYLQFFYAQNVFYCHISYLETGMTGGDSVFVAAAVSNENRAYELVFSAQSDDSDLPCTVYKSFGTATRYGQEIYFALEFTAKEDKNAVNAIDVSITVNGMNYSLAQDLTPPAAEPDTTAVNTTQPASEKQKTEPSQNTTAKTGTTKYVYRGGSSGSNAQKYSGGNMQVNGGDTISDASDSDGAGVTAAGELVSAGEEPAASMAPAAKGLIALAGVFAACGIGFIIKYAINSKHKAEAEEIDSTKPDQAYEPDEADYDE